MKTPVLNSGSLFFAVDLAAIFFRVCTGKEYTPIPKVSINKG